MFPDRRQRSFLDPGVLSRLAGFPLFAPADAGDGFGPASESA